MFCVCWVIEDRDPPWHSGYNTWLDPQVGGPGSYINVWHCEGLSITLLQLKDPLELFIPSCLRFSVSSGKIPPSGHGNIHGTFQEC